MKKTVKKLLLSLVCLFLVGMMSSVTLTATAESGEKLKILFVGNSLTRKNKSYRMFEKLGEAGGYSLEVRSLCISGSSLKMWANRNTKPGKKLYKVLEKQNWDYVVLQDQSTIALKKPKIFQKAVKKLAKVIEQTGSELVLNMTWAHQEDSDIYSEYENLTRKEFQKQITKLYMEMGNQLEALVAKSGVAFWYCDKKADEITLFRDERHPTKAGSYLSACTLYATIFQENIPEENLMLEPEKAELLRAIAEKVTFTDMGNF